LGRIWSWLPIGDVGYRMNLFSAFAGALTVALADRILRRWNVGPWAAFGAWGVAGLRSILLGDVADRRSVHPAHGADGRHHSSASALGRRTDPASPGAPRGNGLAHPRRRMVRAHRRAPSGPGTAWYWVG